ncbi:MAG: hypothetical protein AWM53_01890 [Candidatus Dichloromethanomonas elyunquensis]|nr:MAG: hypothetical protein AWM53_01890 [Candidatus Dichloromethanomonas elyunquensis]
MCLMITLLAAVITTIVWYVNAPENKLKLGTLSLMYWGAALMWTIDGFFCVAEGEPFLDLSVSDALLGLLIVICGLIAWLLILLYSDPKKVFKAFQFKS